MTFDPAMTSSVQPAVRARDAYGLGVSRGELAGPRWRSSYRGIHVPAGTDSRHPRQRAYEAAELLPSGAALGGWAAAHLLGVPYLDGRGASGTELEPVLIVVPPPQRITQRPGTRLIRSVLTDDDVVEVDGVRVTSPERTAFDVARLTGGREAVVRLDAVARALDLRLDEVLAYATERKRWQGRSQALRAVRLADPRAASPGETRLRLVWVLDAGLPQPQVNARLSTSDGDLIGIVDLLDADAGLVGEYDGAGHRDLSQHTVDNAREEWLEAANLVVVRATAVDLRPSARARTVSRFRSAYRRGLGRDRARDSWVWQRA
jgi:hypothetical protein